MERTKGKPVTSYLCSVGKKEKRIRVCCWNPKSAYDSDYSFFFASSLPFIVCLFIPISECVLFLTRMMLLPIKMVQKRYYYELGIIK